MDIKLAQKIVERARNKKWNVNISVAVILNDRIKELEEECIVIAKSHDEIQDRAEDSKSRVLNICSQILSFIDAVDEHGIKSWTAKDEIEAKIKELLQENEV